MIIADTDVLIDYLAGKNPAAGRIGQWIQEGELRTTVISRFELFCGARTKHQMKIMEDLFASIITMPLEIPSADRAAQVRRALDQAGRPIGMGDSLIAGIVLVGGGFLYTRNRQHFEKVEGLSLASE